jgi:acyl-CoA synthetase (AMP-forming)/AMP-acid ligase II
MLIELLRTAAAAVPGQPAVVTVDRSVTYADLLARAEALGAGLAAKGIERFAAVLDDPADVLVAMAGSSAVSSESCCYPVHLDADGIAALARSFDHDVIVTRRDLTLDGCTTCSPDDLTGTPAPDLAPPERSPVLILTTGTTGEPKGARHDWARLVAAVRNRRVQPGSRWFLGYDLNQFAGVQLLLHVVATQGTLVASPTRSPREAPAFMRDLGVTHASATPTFWRFLAASIDEETARALPLVQITLGGEATPAPLLGELRRLFPDARVSQVYASTEFGSSVSVRDGDNGLPLSVLERGDDADVQLRIQDGELWVRSRIGMLGYHGDEGGDAGAGDDGWRPTGDLVEVEGDRIRFVGRTSDRINVGGVKVHPLPVEEAVGAVAGVQVARAYGKPNPITGQILALDVVARPGVDTEALEEEIRAACEVLPPAGRPRLIRFVDDLEVRGGKIARRSEEQS